MLTQSQKNDLEKILSDFRENCKSSFPEFSTQTAKLSDLYQLAVYVEGLVSSVVGEL